MTRCAGCGGTGECARCAGAGRGCTVCFGTGNCFKCSGAGRIGNFQFEVRGENAEEVERVAKAILDSGFEKMPLTPSISIQLTNSTIGILNTGEIEDVQSISVNLSTLAEAGHTEVAAALKALTEAVAASREISSDERTYILDNLEELSKQAALAANERTKNSVIKSIFSGVASSLGAAGGLAEVWSTWGNVIRAFFGL